MPARAVLGKGALWAILRRNDAPAAGRKLMLFGKPKKPVTKAIWMTLVKRWCVVCAVGFAIAGAMLYLTHGAKPGHYPIWMELVYIGGSLLAGLGMFGIVLNLIFHLIHRDR